MHPNKIKALTFPVLISAFDSPPEGRNMNSELECHYFPCFSTQVLWTTYHQAAQLQEGIYEAFPFSVSLLQADFPIKSKKQKYFSYCNWHLAFEKYNTKIAANFIMR